MGNLAIKLAVGAALASGEDLLLYRQTTGEGGQQARAGTTSDFLTHFCFAQQQPLEIHACAADVNTGGNPSPRDPATPMNLILQCSGAETLVCEAPGNNIHNMCCNAVLPQGVPPGCILISRVLNGGGNQVLVTSQIEARFAADQLEIHNLTQRAPILPRPYPGQVFPLLTSVATAQPVEVMFNRGRNVETDMFFFYCGMNRGVTFSVAGTAISAESDVFICKEETGANCGAQDNWGTDKIIGVFHSIQSGLLEYGRKYFVRVFSFGHSGSSPNITVTVSNTIVPLPAALANELVQLYYENVKHLSQRE